MIREVLQAELHTLIVAFLCSPGGVVIYRAPKVPVTTKIRWKTPQEATTATTITIAVRAGMPPDGLKPITDPARDCIHLREGR